MKSTCSNNGQLSSEYSLVCSITEFLSLEGYRVRLEVSNLGQSIDVVATNNRWVTAIEVKLCNWRRALEQCQAHTLVADFIVVAISQKKVPDELLSLLSDQGWGLLHYSEERRVWDWIAKPKLNSKIWKPQRKQFSQLLRTVKHVA